MGGGGRPVRIFFNRIILIIMLLSKYMVNYYSLVDLLRIKD